MNFLKNITRVQSACLLALVIFPIYLFSMSPSVTVGDSGEFIAAASSLSLPHAPSYPLFTLLGKCAILLNPWANIAYKSNLLALFFGVMSCVFLFILARQLGLRGISSAFAAAIFALSGLLREQSAATEVFTLNAFFLILIACVLCADRESFSPTLKMGLSGFLLGLGLGNHHTLVLTGSLVALFYAHWKTEKPFAGQGMWGDVVRDALFFGLFFTAGFSIYLFLPIRSLQEPPLDWSNPENLANFIRVVTRADYGSLSLTLGEKLPRNLDSAIGQIVRYVDSLAGHFTWPVLALSFLGWVAWFFRDARRAGAFLAFFLLCGPGFLILGNLPFDAQSNGILPRFYLMSMVPLVLACGFFMEEVIIRFPALAFLFLLVPAGMLYVFAPHLAVYRSDFTAYDYGRNLLRSLKPGSILFMDGGDDTFYTLAYFSISEGRRKDAEFHDRGGLIFRNPYGSDFRKITKLEKEARRQEVERAYLGLRPLYYATFNPEALQGAALMHRGLVSEAVPSSLDPKSPQARQKFLEDYRAAGYVYWHVYSERGVYEAELPHLYRERALLPIYPFLAGQPEGRLDYFRRAAGFGTDILWLRGNLTWESSLRGYELSAEEKFDEARKTYEFILETDPQFVSAYCNLGVLAEKRNDLERAENYYRKAIQHDPQYPEAYYNLGALYWKREKWSEVIRMFEKVRALNLGHPAAAHYMELARQKMHSAGVRKK